MTYDDDFVLDIAEDAYYGVLYLPDASLTAMDVGDAIHSMLDDYPQEELQGLQYVSTDWL